MSFSLHDAKNYTIVLSDIPINEGVGPDTFLTCAPEGEAFGDSIGAYGDVCRHNNHETRSTVELTLMNSSKHNVQLSALHAADVNAPNGVGVGAMLIKDNSGSTVLAAPQCWIQKRPDWELGKEVGVSTWVFRIVSNAGALIVGGK